MSSGASASSLAAFPSAVRQPSRGLEKWLPFSERETGTTLTMQRYDTREMALAAVQQNGLAQPHHTRV